MKVGRPTKFEPAYCEAVIDHMADGASITSFAAEIGVSRATINVWMAEYPEFLEAVTIAKAKAQAWWEKTSRNLATTGTGNATICVFSLKNLGADDFKDKRETELTGANGGPIQHEHRKAVELTDDELAAIAAKASE